MEITLYLHFLQLCTVARFFSLQEIKITFRKLVSTRFYNFLLFKTFLKLINFCHGFEGLFIFFTGLSINTYTNLDKMASRQHSKKNTKTKTKPKRETKQQQPKKMEKQREFPTYKMLKTCSLGWRCEITSFCSGEIKTKASIIIYHGEGGERKNEGGIA